MNPEENINITENEETENGKKKSSRYLVLLTILCSVLAFIFGVVITMYFSGTTLKELQLKSFINRMYDGKIDPEIYEDYQMKGIVSGLGDKNSFYFTPEEMTEMTQTVSGKFGGVGIEMQNQDGKYVITGITGNSPAEKQGLLTDDIIISVDGVSASDIPFEKISEHVRGEIGTAVVLGIERNGEKKEFELIREEILVESVDAKIIEDNIGYVQISSFDEDTNEELDKAISELGEVDSLVLDLRNNLGGFLHVCADAADLFLEKDKTIVKACYKNSENIMKTKSEAKYTMPMVILVNEYSASSSEIFASCMQDNGRAKIVGTKTFGKGSIQRSQEFYDGSGVNLTVGHFYSPNGNKIDGVGVKPDVTVDLSETEDNQLRVAIDALKAK